MAPRGQRGARISAPLQRADPITEFERLSAALADDYRLEREVGAGGMATVYLATDLRHERQVAIKVLRPDLSESIGSERFLQEIRIAARLGHPHIVPLLDSGAVGGGTGPETLYYVMPFIKGESLRQRLEREGELPVPDVLRVMRDVADALSHAHEQGVVHRDIKPENILISGRHALVTDFGVAKALRAALGRGQATTVGMALGTPMYMAPEQAAADPNVDHRADVYALGVVAYEMLTGSPPFTGNSAQQVLAAHVSEAPRHVTTRRPAAPAALSDAIMRCLEKKAADRWQSAGDLVAQLEQVHTPSGGSTPSETQPYTAAAATSSKLPFVAVGVAALAALGIAGVWASGSRPAAREAEVTLRDRTQITFSGRVNAPTISPDGKQLAYVLRDCTENSCTYAVEVQDVGGTARRRVLEGAASAYFIEWSADRRHLLVTGTIERRWGTFLVSLLGGPLRRVAVGGTIGGGGATFDPSGDSLYVLPAPSTDSTQWISVTTLSGTVRDSIPVATRGRRMAGIVAAPGSPWLAVALTQFSEVERVVLDRQGREASRAPTSWRVARLSADALWEAEMTMRDGSPVTRTALNPTTGELSSRVDTVYTGRFMSVSVTADGGSFVVDAGSSQHRLFALNLGEVLSGSFPESRLIDEGSAQVLASLSPDGSRILLRRATPRQGGREDVRWAIRPFDGGAEVPLSVPPSMRSARWIDPSTLALHGRAEGGRTFALFDVASGALRNVLTVRDTTVISMGPLPDGWIWTSDGQSIMVHTAGATRTIPKPAWYEVVFGVTATPAGRVFLTGWNAGTIDTLGISELTIGSGESVLWTTEFADDGRVIPLPDETAVFVAWEAFGMPVLHHLTGPGSRRRIGAVPRPITDISLSGDFQRAVISTEDYFGDAWMSRVVRR